MGVVTYCDSGEVQDEDCPLDWASLGVCGGNSLPNSSGLIIAVTLPLGRGGVNWVGGSVAPAADPGLSPSVGIGGANSLGGDSAGSSA